jgi:fermentation-respiration switch protein FrsA (DUF1100 family)
MMDIVMLGTPPRTALRRAGRTLALGLAFFTLLVGGLVMLGLERRIIYFPSREEGPAPADFGLPAEELHIKTPDGESVHGYYVRRSEPAPSPRLTLLVSHGNAGTAADRLPRAALFHKRLDVDVVLYDYRGYGRSSGSPTEEGTYIDARAVYDWLVGRGVPASQIVLFGESLGCAVSLQLALDRQPRAVVLEAPFLSVRAMATLIFPWLPVGPLLRTHYDNHGKIGRVSAPILIIHGTEDEVIPYAQGEALFAQAREPKRFLAVPGAHHNDVYAVGGDRYLTALREFLPNPTRR